MELLGEMPKALALSGKYSHEMFNRRGELRHINRLRLWPLMSVLKEKYLMDPAEAELLSSFLMPMLHYYPDTRATAAEMVKHPWLDGVVVQGELEMAARSREGGAASGTTAAAASSGGGGGATGAAAALEEVLKLGPSVRGMVGLGRV